jgi:hypothetical protein
VTACCAAFFSLWLAASLFAQEATPAPAPESKWDATLVPDKAVIMPGEPLYVSLVVKNNSGETRRVLMRDDYAGADDHRGPDGGMARRFTLTAVDKAGVAAPAAPLTRQSRGSIVMTGSDVRVNVVNILPGKSKTFRLYLPWRVAFGHPGSYTLTATTSLGLYFEKGAIPITASAPLEVIPPDKEKMEEALGELEKKAMSKPPTQDSVEAYEALKLAADDCAALWFGQQAKSGGIADRDNAMYALSDIDSEAALAGLKGVVEEGGLDILRVRACYCLMRSPQPGAIPYLLTQTQNPDAQVRLAVVEVIRAKVPPEKAIPLLKEMAEDRDETVSSEAKACLAAVTGKKSAARQDAPEADADHSQITSSLRCGDVVFAATMQGVYTAPVATKAWRKLDAPQGMPPGGRFIRQGEETQVIGYYIRYGVYPGPEHPSLFYASKDGGKTWRLTSQGRRITEFYIHPDGSLYACEALPVPDDLAGLVSRGTVLWSKDMGATWKDIKSNMPVNFWFHDLKQDTDHPALVRVTGSGGNAISLFTADDADYHWHEKVWDPHRDSPFAFGLMPYRPPPPVTLATYFAMHAGDPGFGKGNAQ